MNVVTSLGMLAAFAFLVPVAIIFIYRLYFKYSLTSLAIYFFIAAFYNLMAVHVIPVSEPFKHQAGLVNNYLDVPLMLCSFLFFCTTPKQKGVLYVSLVLFVAYEVMVTIALGFGTDALVYILGPGVLLLFAFAIYYFVRYARIAIERNKLVGKTLMLASIAFAYGCYAMIYCFHYIQKTPEQADVFLIYYVASIIASAIMSTGLLWISKRGVKIKEVQITRRELALFFNH